MHSSTNIPAGRNPDYSNSYHGIPPVQEIVLQKFQNFQKKIFKKQPLLIFFSHWRRRSFQNNL